jgi:D-arabinose 1-dehydrogenase-like Zn-dependent alcohol dehydrogenase
MSAWETVCAEAEFGGYTKNGGFAEYLIANPNYFAQQADTCEAVRKGSSGGDHVVLITAPSLSAFNQGVGMTRKRGTCVLVGLPPGDFPVPLFDVVANCITIRGSFVGNREDMAETLAFAAQCRVKAEIDLQPLFDRLEHGKFADRVVLDFVAAEAHENDPTTRPRKKLEEFRHEPERYYEPLGVLAPNLRQPSPGRGAAFREFQRPT